MKREALILVLLLALGGVVQGFMIFRAVTPAQDAVRFVSIAQRMEREGTLATLRDETEHPLYPLAIRCAYPVVSALRGPQLDNWAVAAQWSAALPLVLCVVPLYLLLRMVATVRGAAVGTILFSFGRDFASLGASALSDGWTLLFTCVFLACVAKLILGTKSHNPSSRWLPTAALAALSGVALGIAATAHQLALVSGAAALAMAIVLMFCCETSWRMAVARLSCCGLFFALGFAVLLGSWLSAAAVDSPSSAIAQILGRETAETDELAEAITNQTRENSDQDAASTVADESQSATDRRASRWSLGSGLKMSFAKKDPSLSLRRHGFFAAAKGYGRELSQAVGFVLGCLTLTGLGLLILRKQATGSQQLRAARRPLPAFFTGFFLLYSGVLFAGASRFGYIESRHLLPAVIALVPLAIDAVAAISSGLELRAASPKPGERVVPLRRTPLRFAYLVCVALAFVSLVPRAHASRTTHRAAAKWLAQTDLPAGTVLDTRGWTQFYSGRTTHLLSAGRAALKDPQLRYIVLERQELEFDSTRAATLREIVGSSSKPVAIFAADDGPHKDVLVYQWQAERFATRKTRLAQR